MARFRGAMPHDVLTTIGLGGQRQSDDAVRQASDLTIGAAGEGDVVFGRFSFDFEFEPQFDRW